MKQLLTTLLLLFSLTLSAQTTVVTGPKKKHQTSAPAKQKQQESSPKPQQTKKTDSSQKKANLKPNGKKNQPQAAVKQPEVKDIPISFDESTMTLHYGDQSLKMILVEGGKFVMGEPKKTKGAEFKGSEKSYPAHLVCLSDYYISETCVSGELYNAITNNGLSNSKWNDCLNFINRLNRKTSMKFGIPTESEWEFAMRGGKYSKHTKFIGTDYQDEITYTAKNEIGISDYNHNSERVMNVYYDYDYSHTYNPGLFELTNWIVSCRNCTSLNKRLKYSKFKDSDYEPTGIPFRIVLHMKSERSREQQLTEILNLHEEQKVDLGLSVYWAGYNLSVDEIDYTLETLLSKVTNGYKQKKRRENIKTYYQRMGIVDEKGTLKNEYDPARQMWGEEWRLPTKKDIVELQEKCSWVWLCYKGVDGFYITGPNGNSIFLPARNKRSYRTQYYIGNSPSDYDYQDFWSGYACSEIEENLLIKNDYLEYPEIHKFISRNSYYGLSNDGGLGGPIEIGILIRPVSDK